MKKKKSCFLNTSAEANLLFPDVCHPVNGQGGLHALSNIKKRDSLTDSHLMDTSRCCHRTRFSAQWTKLAQPWAPNGGCHRLAQSPAQHAHTEWRGGLKRGKSTRPRMLNRMRWLELCSNLSFASPFPTRGVAFMFADHQIQRHRVQPSERGCAASNYNCRYSAPPTASHWQGRYLCHHSSDWLAFC